MECCLTTETQAIDHYNLVKSNLVLVERSGLITGEKVCWRWRRSRLVISALASYVNQVNDLRHEQAEGIHISVIQHLQSGSNASCDFRWGWDASFHIDEFGGRRRRSLKVQEPWQGLQATKDTYKPIERVYQDIQKMLECLLLRKNTPGELDAHARAILHLWTGKWNTRCESFSQFCLWIAQYTD